MKTESFDLILLPGSNRSLSSPPRPSVLLSPAVTANENAGARRAGIVRETTWVSSARLNGHLAEDGAIRLAAGLLQIKQR